MKLLVLGGTAWVGREVATRARRRGHQVTCLARGHSGPVASGVPLLVRNRDEQYGLLPLDDDWDAVIDVTRNPEHVRRATHQIKTSWYGFVSSTSVYADLSRYGLTESAPVRSPADLHHKVEAARYGSAKVSCENLVREAYGDDALIARVGLIGGPGDNSYRTRYWPWRFAHPSNPEGAVLVPYAPDQPTQLLDVRDFADWLLYCAERQIAGTYNATGPARSFSELLARCREVTRHRGPVVAASQSWLRSVGVSPWAGPRSLPHWLPDPDLAGLCAIFDGPARAQGLTCRPLRDTLSDTVAAEASSETTHQWVAGLRDEDERELLTAYAKR